MTQNDPRGAGQQGQHLDARAPQAPTHLPQAVCHQYYTLHDSTRAPDTKMAARRQLQHCSQCGVLENASTNEHTTGPLATTGAHARGVDFAHGLDGAGQPHPGVPRAARKPRHLRKQLQCGPLDGAGELSTTWRGIASSRPCNRGGMRWSWVSSRCRPSARGRATARAGVAHLPVGGCVAAKRRIEAKTSGRAGSRHETASDPTSLG